MKYRDLGPGSAYLRSFRYSFYSQQFFALFGGRKIPFAGWGRKRSGRLALLLARIFHRDFLLLEDGFVRSIGLGADGFSSFSVVEDDVGIYYDATRASGLENLLNYYDFETDREVMQQARKAIGLIRKYRLSKYNSSVDVDERFRAKYALDGTERRVLVIIQTAGDASLRYGLSDRFSTSEMIDAAIDENPDAAIYAKIHPDVLCGKRESDIDPGKVGERCRIIDDDLNPLSLLRYFDKVYTKTSQMGFEALLLGKECVCFGMPFYAGWGVTDDRVSCERRQRTLSPEEIFAAAYIKYSRYFDRYSQKESDIFGAISTIAKYRMRDRRVDTKAFLFGFSLWKHRFIKPFIRHFRSIHFINPLPSRSALYLAKRKGLDEKSRILIWGKKAFSEIERYAEENHIPISRVEDGFIRSVGLGSDLTQPYSLVIDSRGIYFDPTAESDLEHILNYHPFTADELNRAKEIKKEIIRNKISKYNSFGDSDLEVPEGKKIVLVPGQVEDDASIRYGAPGMTNLKLLQEARRRAPKAYILYKPHPDVLAGNRIGQVDPDEAMAYCDRIIEALSLDSVLAVCDEVHTMTSLVGFEAMMRGIHVYTYGLPFYAGWGLSIDLQHCDRRVRVLNIDELVAGSLILYPRYLDPLSDTLCETEVALERLKLQRERLEISLFFRKSVEWRTLLNRRLQQLWRLFYIYWV